MFYSESMNLWVERVKENGKTKQITAKTQKALKAKLKKYEDDAEHGRTFAQCADGYEATLEKKVEENTRISYKAHINRAKDFFDGEYIKDITPDEVQAFVDYLVEMDFAKDTVRRGLVIVNKIFKYAITSPNSEIRFNPCAAVEIPRGLKQEIRQPPTEEQLVKVTPEGEVGLFAFFLLCTGLRPGELLSLRWEDVDRENKSISVTKTVQYASNQPRIKDSPKTAAGVRTVPILDVLDAALPNKHGNGYIFGGEKPWTKTMLRKKWLSWCREVGLAESETIEFTGKNGHRYTKTKWKPTVTAYQFRHEYASMLEDEGVKEFDAQHVMGHASIVTTKDKYTAFRNKKNLAQSEVATKLNARFNSKV